VERQVSPRTLLPMSLPMSHGPPVFSCLSRPPPRCFPSTTTHTPIHPPRTSTHHAHAHPPTTHTPINHTRGPNLCLSPIRRAGSRGSRPRQA
jgi:hypothetical protein